MESSSSASGFFASPRRRRRVIWGGGAALAVGLFVILSTVVFRGSPGIKSPLSTVPAQSAPKEIKAPPDPKAYTVARKFIETAVSRQNVDAAYSLVTRDIRGSQTRKQWDTGNIAVIKYPAANAKKVGFSVLWSYKTEMMTEVDLIAKKGSHVRHYVAFRLGLERAHHDPKGRWLVDYFQADYTPSGPTNGNSG